MKTKMWDVFLNDMGLDRCVQLALTHLGHVTFDDGDPFEGSSYTLSSFHVSQRPCVLQCYSTWTTPHNKLTYIISYLVEYHNRLKQCKLILLSHYFITIDS